MLVGKLQTYLNFHWSPVLHVSVSKILRCTYVLVYERHIIVQLLSGRLLDFRSKDRWFKPHLAHCVVSLSKTLCPVLVLVQAWTHAERIVSVRKTLDWGSNGY